MNTTCEATPAAADFEFAIAGLAVQRTRNEVFYSQGDAADAVFYLENGHVKLSVLSGEGKQAVVGILGPGAFFGESCLADRLEREAAATALTRSTARKIAKREFLRALQTQPGFSEFFLSRVLSRTLRLEEDLADQLCHSCDMRLARTLVLFAEFEPGAHSVAVRPKMDQHTLAAIVGTTQPRISSLLHRFKEQGLIDCVDRLRVNRSLLEFVRVQVKQNSRKFLPDYSLLNNF